MTEIALVFPGQGSQTVGMLADLAAARPEVQETFEEAGRALGIDLWDLIRNGPSERLDRTEVTQPVMLAGGVAVWRCWQSLSGPAPKVMAGHSLGEYSALVAAGALDFADALRVVAERARLMQAAVAQGEGAMAAILGLGDEVVEAICREVAEGQVLAPANYNSPGQLVIAGDSNAVERAMLRCRDAGAKRAMVLPVSVPAHCAMMAPAASGLEKALSGVMISPPDVPVLPNIDGRARTEPDKIRQALIEQVYQPVRWTQSVRHMVEGGITALAECGPGRVLCGLSRRIDRSLECVALDQPDTMKTSIENWREKV
ncbi:MAG: ACP S-malonyltransferase [Wenzhouxiangella sp.]|jgi:[acyl-carrier-protein] S-malonyltransferase|nr:ACP S-malonyltransferase [Wenzhouxiangella sp.]